MKKKLFILILAISFFSSEVFARTTITASGGTFPTMGDFTYLGAFQMPSVENNTYGLGLAFRSVGGVPHLLSMGRLAGTGVGGNAWPIYEVTVPISNLSSTSQGPGNAPSTFPTASLYMDWYSTYGDLTGPLEQGQNITGLYWDANSSRLYFTTTSLYAGGGMDVDTPTLGFLDCSASGACTSGGPSPAAHGLWGYQGRAFQRVNYGVINIPSDFASAYVPSSVCPNPNDCLASGFGGYQSVMSYSNVSMGPSLTAFGSPTASTGNTSNMKCSAQVSGSWPSNCLPPKVLLEYPYGGAMWTSGTFPPVGSERCITPDCKLQNIYCGSTGPACLGQNGQQSLPGCAYDASGDTFYYQGNSVTSSSRSLYPVTGNTTVIGTKSAIPGTGYWGVDVIAQGGAWIQTANKEGILFAADFAAGDVRYVSSQTQADSIESGWLVYSRAQLASIASGTVQSGVSACTSGGSLPCYTNSGTTPGSQQPSVYVIPYPGLPYPYPNSSPTSFLGTSSTSITIGTPNGTGANSGYYVFTTQSGLAYAPGTNVTLYNNSASIVGLVASYSGTTMVIKPYETNGSGTFSSWYVGAGDQINVNAGGMGASGRVPWASTQGVAYDSVGQNLYVLQGANAVAGQIVYVYHVNDPASGPAVTAFTLPATYASQSNMPITTFTGTELGGGSLTGYCINQSATAPTTGACSGTGWQSTAPTQVNAAGTGSQTFYAWVTDGKTVSSSVSATVQTGTYYSVTPSAGSNGAISPNTAQSILSGQQTTFTVTPGNGYTPSMGGTCGGTLSGSTYTTNPITAACTVSATFNPITYSITATAGSNGSISPSGSVPVNSGANQAFTITANTGYQVASVLVDGVSIGATASYTFSGVTANHTISATFAPLTYTITPSGGVNGTITPSTAATVSYGATKTFTVTPNSNYTASVGGTCGGSLAGTTYTTNAVTANCTVTATFTSQLAQYTITPSAGSNGTISPSASVQVNSGSTQTFSVTPNSGYTASVGGTCGGSLAGTTYTTSAITGNCTVTAAFSQQQASNSLIQSSNVTYLGAFTVPNVYVTQAQSTQYSGGAIGFNPSGNGGAGSLLLEGLSGQNSNGLYAAEISIPANANLYTGSSASGFTSSSTAGFVSPNSSSPYFWDISQGHYMDVGSSGANESSNCRNGWGIGGMYVNSTGTIYATSFCWYDELEMASGASGAGLSVLPLLEHNDSPLSGSTYSGQYGLNLGSYFSGNTGDLNSGALASIPSAFQSQLGGTMLVGANPTGMSNIGRTSFGPALTAFNPANFGAANAFPSSVNASALSSYPGNHQTLGSYSGLVNQYISMADGFSAIAFPPNSRSVLVMGTHGVGGPGLACPSMATSGVGCYGEYTSNCSEVCMASPPSGSGIPTCGSGNSTCGGYSRGTWDCCYDPAGLAANPGGHGNTSWPVVSYVWAYDAGNPDGSNTTGNNVPSMPSTASGYTGNTTRNNLTAVKLGYVNPWDLYPYATWQLNDPFNAAANKAQSGYQTSGTYDPVSGKLYVSLQNAQSTLPIIEVYQITPAATTQVTITASAGSSGSISPSGSVQISSGSSQEFTIAPNAGYSPSVGGSCGGTFSDNIFTTGPITASCTVTATFTLIPPPAAPFLPN